MRRVFQRTRRRALRRGAGGGADAGGGRTASRFAPRRRCSGFAVAGSGFGGGSSFTAPLFLPTFFLRGAFGGASEPPPRSVFFCRAGTNAEVCDPTVMKSMRFPCASWDAFLPVHRKWKSQSSGNPV